MAFLVSLVVLLLLVGCRGAPTPTTAIAPAITATVAKAGEPTNQYTPSAGLSPIVGSFISQHPEYGFVKEAADMPDWAEGKRQQVTTTTGSYLFYLRENEVVGVDKYTKDGGRTKVFHKDSPTPPTNVERPPADNLPAYVVIFQVKLITGGYLGDVLIESFSRATPASAREAALKAIARKEGFTEATLYSTMNAYKANVSASYLKQHPDALKQGFLGSLDSKGQFVLGEKLYP